MTSSCLQQKIMDKKKTKKKVFVEGPISPDFIANSIAKHSTKKNIGAHAIFLGQVREDVKDDKSVQYIEYSAYNEMAENVFHEISEIAFATYDLNCMHIYHSLGKVNAGEICLFVFVSSKHRDASFEACRVIVEDIKNKVPIFGKEVTGEEDYTWKENI